MSAQLEPQPVCWFCGEHFRGPEIEVPGLGLLSPCPVVDTRSLGWAIRTESPLPSALAFAPRVPHPIFRIQDWQDPAGNHDPGDEDDAAERAWTAEQIAAMRTLREAFSKILGAELAKVGFETTLLAVPVPP